MLKIVLLTAALSVAQTAAFAADFRDTSTEAFVSTRGVNFGAPDEVRALHVQLERKAARICDSGEPRMLAIAMSDSACAKQAVDRAVAKLNQPLLTAVHEGRPVTAANAQLAQR